MHEIAAHMKDRATQRCAVYLILEQDGKILLQKRKNSGFYDEYYGIPSGHWEYGETVTQALIREVQEETNIIIDPNDLVFQAAVYSYPLNYTHFYFLTNKFNGEIKINEPHKCSDLRFFEYDNLPDNIIPYIKETLGKIASGVRFWEEEILPHS